MLRLLRTQGLLREVLTPIRELEAKDGPARSTGKMGDGPYVPEPAGPEISKTDSG